MKKIIFSLFILINLAALSQVYPSFNINLVGMIHPNTGTVGVGVDGRRYAGCFGWKHPSNNKEFAIVGSSSGVYFIDISTPSTPSVSAFVAGKAGCTWREIQTYQNYAYIVSDDGSPNTFMIIDMTNLPSTVTVVHNGTSYFERGHTIFIDGELMYIGSVTYTAGNTPAFSAMDVYSLNTPTAPLLMARLNDFYPSIQHVHDMYVKNDTVFASCGNQGLHIYKYIASTQIFVELGSYTNYAGSPYNHSSSMTENKKYLVFCDEVPVALPIKLVDVQNLANVQPVTTFQPFLTTTPHNPYVVGNDFVYVSSYQDGLYMYNIATPSAPFIAGYFDTHPQGGANAGNYFNADYRGNWGAYPYLPSGLIIAADMQNGVFILDPAAALIHTDIQKTSKSDAELMLYPNPVSDKLAVVYHSNDKTKLEITNIIGQTVFSKEYISEINDYINVALLNEGTYFVKIQNNHKQSVKKINIIH
ncbi:MAG: choice-of-anchor B family protein [Sphingobacteriaceae bacterium]|nr:choice-of-anchor B family protein [Sphingobacteriaceae bacterium]